MTNGKRKREILLLILIVILILILIWLILHPEDLSQYIQENNGNEGNIDLELITQEATSNHEVDGVLTLTMIDVGQGDSFLLVQDGVTALVDCGTRSTGKDVVSYLNTQGITKIDYVFGTHPHDDHMGGMYDVITSFEIGTIIIPEIEPGEVTTNWYIKLMDEIATNNYDVKYAEVGQVYELGQATLNVIGPINAPNGNLNNYSTVLKVSFGEMDIIMTGDAEKDVEKDILDSGVNLDAEILKVGHHGSDTSTSTAFLDAVSPDFALISCKVGNKYNHPVKVTMDNLYQRNIPVYRTDECGTVTLIITTNTVSFSTDPGDYLSGPELEERSAK